MRSLPVSDPNPISQVEVSKEESSSGQQRSIDPALKTYQSHTIEHAVYQKITDERPRHHLESAMAQKSQGVHLMKKLDEWTYS